MKREWHDPAIGQSLPAPTMTQILICKEEIREFGIYKEDDVLVLGFLLGPETLYESLIFQIETETARADQRCEAWGMYSEIDGEGSYGLVKKFSYHPQNSLLMIDLEKKSTNEVQQLSFELSSFLKDCDSHLIIEMEHIFQTYPRGNDRVPE
jgi:hypothetical protein